MPRGNPNFGPGVGRPKGALNKGTQEAREFATRILDSEDYKRSLELRIRTGELPPQIETLLYYYRYGKPKERVEMEVVSPLDHTDLAALTLEQLQERNRMVALELQEEMEREQRELEAARMAAEIQKQQEAARAQNELLEQATQGKVM